MEKVSEYSKWSSELHRDDIAKRCYQTCSFFKLLRWCSKSDFVGVCIGGFDLTDPSCHHWQSDGYSVDPNFKEGNQLLLFSCNN